MRKGLITNICYYYEKLDGRGEHECMGERPHEINAIDETGVTSI